MILSNPLVLVAQVKKIFDKQANELRQAVQRYEKCLFNIVAYCKSDESELSKKILSEIETMRRDNL